MAGEHDAYARAYKSLMYQQRSTAWICEDLRYSRPSEAFYQYVGT